MTVHQIFTIEDGSISLYEIGETDTIQEMIEKTRTANEQGVSIISFSNHALSKN